MPFILLDFVKLCILTTAHVIIMMAIKKHLNLGELITLTISGGFLLRMKQFIIHWCSKNFFFLISVLLFYLWACVVALYQIIVIVKTEKYQAVYGKDPTAPKEAYSEGEKPHHDEKHNISIVEPILKDNFVRYWHNNVTKLTISMRLWRL